MADLKSMQVLLSGSWQNLKNVNDGVDVACQVLIFSPDAAGSYVVYFSPAGKGAPCMHLVSSTSNAVDDRIVLNPANGIRFSDIDVLGASGKNLYVTYMSV